jgi:isochorismate synthase
MSDTLIEHELATSPFFFASAHNAIFGVGTEQVFNRPIPFSLLASQAQQMLDEAKSHPDDNPVLFGVVPFNPENPTRFVIPQTLYVSSCPRVEKRTQPIRSKASIISSPSGDEYKQNIAQLITMFDQSAPNVSELSCPGLSKVVLSRAIEIVTREAIIPSALLQNLLSINSGGYTFAVNVGDEHQLIGASPELLIARKENQLISNPLVSRPRGLSEFRNDEAKNSATGNFSTRPRQAYQGLSDLTSDLREHALVVREVERVMHRYCHNLHTPMVPSMTETKTMLQLSTRLEGRVRDPQISALQIASELHPSPAVCGYPRQPAYDAIRLIEPFDRGYFTGMVGWCDACGNGEWVVSSSCAEIKPHLMKVFAGAGIVHQSRPQSGLDETHDKMQAILSAAGIQLEELGESLTV